jgi:hypothetical protein
LLLVSCGLFFFIVGALVLLRLVLFFPLPLSPRQDNRSSLSLLLLLSSVSEKSAINVIALTVVAACDVWIV